MAPAESAAPTESGPFTFDKADYKTDFPARDITIIVGYDPGGSSDTITRIMGEYIGKQLGVNMIIENLAGSANMVALNLYMSRPHDGYTLVMIASSDTPWVYERTKPDVQFTGDDFYALGRMTNSIAGMGFITAAGRFEDWPAFVDYCKEKGDGKVNVGVIGPDRIDDLQIDEFEKICGVKFNRIYYSGSSDVQTDVPPETSMSGTSAATA
jgi:tripartite-type tricarboxylate transporter receptor subunit TctC